MRLSLALCAIVLVSACTSNAPYSNVIDTAGGGVGFSDYAQYMRAQEELSRIRRTETPARPSRPQTAPVTAPTGGRADGFGASPTETADTSRTGRPIRTTSLQSDRAGPQTPRRSAEAPRQRAAATGQAERTETAMPENRQEVAAPAGPPSQAGVSTQSYQPQPFGTPRQNRVVRRDYVPQVRVTAAEAPAASGPNLFVYALSTRHSVGEARYTRRNPFRWGRWESACAQYPHQDLAQEAFLAAGGPEKDPEHMDPDGDGYACWWDPAPFRQAATTVKARE